MPDDTPTYWCGDTIGLRVDWISKPYAALPKGTNRRSGIRTVPSFSSRQSQRARKCSALVYSVRQND
jgi:hypothetical protein